MPSVSVCIPAFNSERFLAVAIESVLGQSFQDYEIIVVDNASTDSTPEVVKRFNDPRIRYERNATNIGFSRNLQKALELAQGAFVQFLCDDDFLQPTCIEKSVAMLRKNPEVVFVHTAHQLVDDSETIFDQRIYDWQNVTEGLDFLHQIVAWGFSGVCLSSAMMRRDCLQHTGGVDVALDWVADYGLWTQLCLEGKVAYLSEPLTVYRVHPGQSTGAPVVEHLLKLTEKILTETSKKGISVSFKDFLLKKSIHKVMREFPRKRMHGCSREEIWTRARELALQYPHHSPRFSRAFFPMMAMLPTFLIKFFSFALQPFYKCLKPVGLK